MKRIALFTAALAALVSLAPSRSIPVHAQVADSYGILAKMAAGEPDGITIASDDTDVALLVKYVGSSASGKVAVAANGDITFTDGAQGSEAATSTFECPVSGALGGVIDVSDTACDTLGEVADAINFNGGGTFNSNTGWRAVILDGLRADSSNDTLVTISATAATPEDGLGLKVDTDVAFSASYALGAPRKIGAYMSTSTGGVNPGLVPNPFSGRQANYFAGNFTSTYGSGTSAIQIISCAEAYSARSPGTETCTTLIQIAGGATTANKVLNGRDYAPYGIVGKKGEKMLVRLKNSAAAASVFFNAYGATFRY